MGRLSETLRKSIHLSSLVIPLSYRYIFVFNRKLCFSILLAALALSMVIEFHRFWQRGFRKTFYKVFGMILRKHEMKDFTGATYLLFASMLVVAFLDPLIASASIAFLSIGDTMAALIGINFGKRKLLGRSKSLEGSLACFASVFVFGIFWLRNPILALVGSLAATGAELGKLPLDDNVKIPLASGLAMTLMTLFM